MKKPYPTSARAWFTIVILMLAYVLSFVDRQILNLLVGPIRHDLQISDTQMSLLMGLSFALFYTLCGIPLGRIADSDERSRTLAAAKFIVARAGRMIAEQAIQLHGGIGMTWEYVLAHHAKRLVMLSHQFGDDDHHLQAYCRLMQVA